MVDPFVDPLDTAPVRRPPSPLQSHFMTQAEPAGHASPFSRILEDKIQEDKVQENPTPLLTTEALQPPALLPNTQFNPVTIQEQDITDSSGTGQSPVAEKESQPAAMPESVETSPQNLVELLNLAASSGDIPHIGPRPEAVKEETLSSPPAEDAEPVSESPEPSSSPQKIYTIARGDTLSHIVAGALNQQGIAYNTGDLYRLVNVVAQYNDIPNPNRIFAGHQLDLTPLYSEDFLAKKDGVASKEPDQQAMAVPATHDQTQAPLQGLVTSNFGNRVHPILGYEQFHRGIDIGVEAGTPIRSIQPGRVSFSGAKDGYGQVVQIDHGGGMQSLYAHLSERFVETGDEVGSEDSIGLSGNSGRSTGPHLHFEIRRHGEAVNPLAMVALESIERPYRDESVKLAQGSTSRNSRLTSA
ncbi:MAG: peptidoglycan DD-metalloendopeptidase family protein [bacterium]